jgi:hypothetical protein
MTSRARANKIVIALRLVLMPAQRLMELLHDRLLESRAAGDLRVFFQPGIATPREMTLITEKLAGAVQRLHEIDPVHAAVFTETFHKVYVTSQSFSSTTSSGMPKLPNGPLVKCSITIVAALLVQFVPMVKVGLIRATFQLVDPVPILLEMCEIQISFLHVAEPSTVESREYLRMLEAKIVGLRSQLKRT